MLWRVSSQILMGAPRSQRLAALAAGVLLCLLCVGAVTGTPLVSADSTTEGGIANVDAESFAADRTIFIITVRDDGSAEWRFRYEQRLETEAEIEDFETYADRFNDEETETYRNFRERAIALVDVGSEATGRQMAAEGFERHARIEERPPAGDSFAVIEMSFDWTRFAVADDGRVTVGDVFVDGLYVGPDQQLRFQRGPSLRFESATPEPDSTASGSLADSETITWLGEQSFADREPRIVLGEHVDDTAQNETDESTVLSNGDAGADDPTAGNSDRSVLLLVALGLVVLLGSSAAFAYRRDLPTGSSNGTESAPTEPPLDTPTDTESVSSGASGVTDAEADSPDPVTDTDLVSDEQRVINLLEERGGRMKQVDIVDRTGWSKSKVSMLLSEMDDDGTISKLRVGRENIVSLAGHEPDAAGSPFDDE